MLLLCIKLNYLSPIFNMFLFFRPMAYVELFVSIVIFFLLIRYYLTIILLNLYFFLSNGYGYVSNHLIILNKKKRCDSLRQRLFDYVMGYLILTILRLNLIFVIIINFLITICLTLTYTLIY